MINCTSHSSSSVTVTSRQPVTQWPYIAPTRWSRTHTHTHTHTHTRAHTHAHTHTHALSPLHTDTIAHPREEMLQIDPSALPLTRYAFASSVFSIFPYRRVVKQFIGMLIITTIWDFRSSAMLCSFDCWLVKRRFLTIYLSLLQGKNSPIIFGLLDAWKMRQFVLKRR